VWARDIARVFPLICVFFRKGFFGSCVGGLFLDFSVWSRILGGLYFMNLRMVAGGFCSTVPCKMVSSMM
jgi:hypothetical protein